MKSTGDINRAILQSPKNRKKSTGSTSVRVGQMWSMDFVISVTMFFVSIILVLFAWNYVASENYEQGLFNEMQNAVLTASDVLVRTGGSPPGWNTTAMAIGLASEENVLDENKVRNFLFYMDYNTSRSIIGIRNYEYYFAIMDVNNQLAQIDGRPAEKGYQPSANVNTIVPIQRYAIFQEKLAKIELVIWV